MKIQVAYDMHGRILTAASRAGTKSGPTVSLAPHQGAEVADFDVPEEFEGKHLSEFLHLLRIDTKGKRLVVEAKR
jgi:hypothetical protein